MKGLTRCYDNLSASRASDFLSWFSEVFSDFTLDGWTVPRPRSWNGIGISIVLLAIDFQRKQPHACQGSGWAKTALDSITPGRVGGVYPGLHKTKRLVPASIRQVRQLLQLPLQSLSLPYCCSLQRGKCWSYVVMAIVTRLIVYALEMPARQRKIVSG